MQLSPKCRAILSGRDTRFSARLTRLGLHMAAVPYALAVQMRNCLYDRHLLPIRKLPVPVICVGNITVGGTGKTPMVIWLSRYLRQRGHKVVVLSRGYKGRGHRDNDEILLLRAALPEVEIVVDSNRVRGGWQAIKKYGAEVMVLDDGFQHRRLHRDLDIVMVDATCPFGYGAVLPRGLLREPKEQLRRADAAVLTRSDAVEEQQLTALAIEVQNLLQDPTEDCRKGQQKGQTIPKVIAYSSHEPAELFDSREQARPGDELQGKKVLAFCGIGNPEAFGGTLRRLGAEVVGLVGFDDHVHYEEAIFARMERVRAGKKADCLVTTEKDWVKLRQFDAADRQERWYWLRIRMRITQGEAELKQRIDALWENHPKKQSHPRNTMGPSTSAS